MSRCNHVLDSFLLWPSFLSIFGLGINGVSLIFFFNLYLSYYKLGALNEPLVKGIKTQQKKDLVWLN